MPRLFFALWPDEDVRSELYLVAQRVHPASGGRLMRRENLHQTIVFIGNVTEPELAALKEAGDSIDAARFTLQFGTLRYWRHNRIVWAAPLATPEPLARLVTDLETRLGAAGIKFDQRPYEAHITLVRDARRPEELPALDFEWTLREFVLVDSSHDGRHVVYRPIARWPLAG